MLAAGALAACGGNTGRSSGGGGTGGGTSGGSGGGGTISQWYHQYGEAGTEQAVKRYAAAYKKATVKVQWIPGNYDQKSAAALLTNSGPDVFEYGNGPTIDMITGEQVVDLTDVYGAAKSDFTPSLLDRMTWKGKIYGVPQVVDMQLFVYRKSMLRKAGVQPPQTLDELISAAAKLTTGKVKGLFLGNDGGAGILAGPVLWSSGHDYLTSSNQPDFANADVASALGKFHDLFTSGHLLLGAPTDWSDPGAITSGLTAIQWTGLWNFPMLQDKLGDDFGVLPFPAIGGSGKPSVPVGAFASCVSARAKDVAAAKAFVKWLWVDQTADQLDFAQSYGFHVPSRTSLIAKATKLKTGEAKAAAGYLKAYGHPQTPLLWSPKSATAMTDAVDKIVRSGANPTSSLAGVQKVVTAELKRIGG